MAAPISQVLEYPHPFPLKPIPGPETSRSYEIVQISPSELAKFHWLKPTARVALDSLSGAVRTDVLSAAKLHNYYKMQFDGMCGLQIAVEKYREYLGYPSNVKPLYEAAKWFVEVMGYAELPHRAGEYLTRRLSTWSSSGDAQDALRETEAKLMRYEEAQRSDEVAPEVVAILQKEIKGIIFERIFNKEDSVFMQKLAANYDVYAEHQKTLNIWVARGIGVMSN